MEPIIKQLCGGGSAIFRVLVITALLLLSGSSSLLAAPSPDISGTHTTYTDDQSGAVSPFTTPNVSISSTNASVAVIITLDDAGKGSFTTLSGFTDHGGGVYSYTNTDNHATTAIQGMQFTPTANRVAPMTYEATFITVAVIDAHGVVTNSDTQVNTLSINDPPTLTGVTSSRNTNDKLSTNVFAGFMAADVDLFGTQAVTLKIMQDDSAKGTLQTNTSGFTGGPITYTFTGTPADATTAIQALVFDPTENRVPVGSNEVTTFIVTLTDTNGASSANSPLTVTVASLSSNDPPVISNVSSTHLPLVTGTTGQPFSGVHISDPDVEMVGGNTNLVPQPVSLSVTFDSSVSGNGQWFGPAGLGFVSGSTYTLLAASQADANYAIQHLTYQAQTFPLVQTTNHVGFTIIVTDNHGLSTTNTTAVADVFTPFTPPGLSGTRSNQRVNDNATVALFSSVSIKSFNGGFFEVILSIDYATNGSLINLGQNGFRSQGSNYVFTGTSQDATANIRQLLFQPTTNQIAGGSTQLVTFFITLVDGTTTNLPDASTTVIVSPVNDAPIIKGISHPASITDAETAAPFSGVEISDVDELGRQADTVTISLNITNLGYFTNLSGFSSNANGTYTLSGPPATNTAAIHQLIFVPSQQLRPYGSQSNVVFTIRVDDGQGGVAIDDTTVIRIVFLAGGPTINVPAPQPVSLPTAASLHPFNTTTLSDAQNITLTVQATNPAWGSFVTNSLGTFTNSGPGSFTTGGSPGAVQSALQGLAFAPDPNLPLGSVIAFSLTAVDQVNRTNEAPLAIVLRLNQRSLIVTTNWDYGPNGAPVGGTLRKAVQDAGSNDHITFDLRSAQAGQPGYPATIRLKAPLILNNNVFFDGPGADNLSISGDTDTNGTPDQQLFVVNAQVVMNRLTLTKGHSSLAGGAVEVGPQGALKMSYCAVTDSRADVWGGGIDVNGGSLILDRCLIKGNSTSPSFGRGGGGVSLFTDQVCEFVNSTFAGNQQLAPSGLGGGGLYAETQDPGSELDVYVLSCTFAQNTDAAGHGTSIRPNVVNTEVWLQNTIVADGQGKNLEMDQSGDVISLGGNLSDDGTTTIFSIGGFPFDTTIFAQPPDFTNTPPVIGPLTNNQGPTFTYALSNNSPAINATVSNSPAGTFYGTLGTDQRGYWRTNGAADIGAFEFGASQRVILEEILFANTNNQFIEFYVPHDSVQLDLANFQVLVHGQLLHTFTSQSLRPGEALVLYAQNAVNPVVPSGVYKQIAANNVLMDPSADTITVLNSSNQVVLEVSYVGTFVSSDPNDPGYLSAPNQSIVLSPQFQGCYLPYQRVVAKEASPSLVGNNTSNPGRDASGHAFAAGNAPPLAFNDSAATDAQTPLPLIDVLANDKDPDITDKIRVVAVGVTNNVQAGVATNNVSHYGATVVTNGATVVTNGVTVVTNGPGLSVKYDPRTSAFLTSLPQGSNVVDWFQYTILDSSNGVDHARSSSNDPTEISNNVVKATATVSVTITGVNLPPTPRDDGLSNLQSLLHTTQSAVLDFPTASTILTNDIDPNTDDNATTLTIISVELTNVYQNSLQTLSTLGAFVTLDIRFDRNQTHIRYDPSGSALLRSLTNGQTAVDTFYYSVMDSHGAIGTAGVYITVTGLNDPPQANPDQVTTDQNTPTNIPAAFIVGNDIDPDTGITNPVIPVLTITRVDAISTLGAQVKIVGNTVVYDPTGSSALRGLGRKEFAVDTFTYTIQDYFGASSTNTVSVTVAGLNDPPIAMPDAYSTGEKIPLAVPARGVLSNDQDPDIHDTIRAIPFSKTSTMGAPVVLNADGSFTYDPRGVFDWLAQGQLTNDTFTYSVMDHSLTIANDDVFRVQANSSSNVLRVLANDALLSGVGGALSITSVSTPSNGGSVSIDPSGQTLIYSPRVNSSEVETFTYFISDGLGGSDFANVSVTANLDIRNGNLVANPDAFTVVKGTTVNLDVLANDNILPAAGSQLTILSAPHFGDHSGTISVNGTGPGNSLTYTPGTNSNFPFKENFTYVITGGGIAVSTGTVSVLVVMTNTLPSNQDTFTVIANGANYFFDVLANDRILPGPKANLTITSLQAVGLSGTVVTNSDGTGLLYRPPTGLLDHQEPVITYTFSDGAGGIGTNTVSVFVLAAGGSGFFANPDSFTVTKNSQGTLLPVLMNDTVLPNSGQTLTITDVGIGLNAPNHGGTISIDPSSSTMLIYTPAANYVGQESFTYEISYGTTVRAQGQVTVTVIDTVTLPSQPDTYSIIENSPTVGLPVLQNDYPLPRTSLGLTITAIRTNLVKGTVSISGNTVDNTLLYAPGPGFIGRDVFFYETSDGLGNKGTNQVTVTVGNLTLNPDQFSVLSGSSSNVLDVLANDPLLPDITTIRPITGLGTPDHGGTVSTINSGALVLYKPAAGFVGTERFSYRVTDDAGGLTTGNATVSVVAAGSDRATNTVTVTLMGTNDPPTITGTRGGWAITDKQSVQPFTNATIADVDAHGLLPLTVSVTLDNSIKGILTNLGGFSSSAPGVYTMTGVGTNVTASLRGLFFVPTQNRITVPNSENTTLTVAANDGIVTTTDNLTVINVTSVNDPPVVSGTLSNQRVYDRLSIMPFAGTTISDVDNQALQPLNVTITIAQPIMGFLTSLGSFVQTGTGVYSLTNVTGAQATAAIRPLIYVPTSNGRLTPGTSETNQFAIAVNDGFAPTVTDNNTTVISTDAFVRRTGLLDGTTKDLFNYSVSANRDLVAVGAPNDTNTASIKTGSVSLLSRTNAGPESWGVLKRVIGSDSVAGDQFGFAVGLSSNTLVVGAPTATVSSKSSGVAYVFTNVYVNATQAIKLVPGDGANGDQFGQAIAIHGDTIVVGAYLNTSSGTNKAGSAYVYGRNQGGNNNWGLVKKLAPTDGANADFFGISVAINVDTIAIGSQANNPGNNTNRAGAVYSYDRNAGGPNNWGLTKKLAATDGASNDGLGHSVAVSGNLIVAGAPFVSINNSKSGRIYVFDRNFGGVNNWGQTNEFLPSDGIVGSQFGNSVTVDGELFAAGTLQDIPQGGAVYVYARTWPGLTNWSPLEKFLPSTNDTYAGFGWAISLSQNTLAAGAHLDIVSNSTRFAETYIFRLKFDNGPTVTLPIPNQTAVLNTPFSYTVPAGTFADDDVNDSLTLSLTSLPTGLGWLGFNGTTGAFSGTPTNTVTTSFAVGVRATDQDGASVTNTFTLTVQSGPFASPDSQPGDPLGAWRHLYFPGEWLDPSLADSIWGDNADPDGDGASNLQEYVFGGNPLRADPGDATPLSISAGPEPGTLLLTYKRRYDDPNLVYSIEHAAGSAGWQTVDNAGFLSETVEVLGQGVARVTDEVRAASLAAEPHFFRVSVTFLAHE
jgi:hypothetical protein